MKLRCFRGKKGIYCASSITYDLLREKEILAKGFEGSHVNVEEQKIERERGGKKRTIS